jgi:hypothetical protein
MGQRHQATGCQSSADGIITGVALPHELAEAECAGVGALLAACEVEVGVVVADVALVLLPSSSGSGLLLLQLLPSSSCSGGLLLLAAAAGGGAAALHHLLLLWPIHLRKSIHQLVFENLSSSV